MTWMRQTSSVAQSPSLSDDRRVEALPHVPDDGRRGDGPSGPGFPAAAVLVIVLGLTLVLMIWAPWRVDRLTVSDFGARGDATAPAVANVPARIATAGPPAPAAQVAVASPTLTPGVRPVGLPLRRNDWIIVKDYVANGGPGPTGAIDIGVVGNRDAVGTPVYATSEGTVKVVPNTRNLGNLVVVRSGRWITTYGYLDQSLVAAGQQVRRGDQIGTLGRSGQAPGPMLNYQVWEQIGAEELNRNPMEFIAPR